MMPNSNQQQQQQFNFLMKNNPMNAQQQHQQPGPGGPNQMGMHPSGGVGGFPPNCDMDMIGNPWGGPNQMTMDPLRNTDPNMFPDPIDGLQDPLSNNPPMSNLPHQSPSGIGGNNSCSMDPTSPNLPSLQMGVKIPDEELTPVQRQNRAVKLRQLQDLQNMFKSQPPLNDCQMDSREMIPGGGVGGGPGIPNGPGEGPCAKMPIPNAMAGMIPGNGMNQGMMNHMQGGPPMQGDPQMQGPPMRGMMGNPHGMPGGVRPNFMNMGPRGPMCRMPMNNMNNMNNMNDEMSGLSGGMTGGGMQCGNSNLSGPMGMNPMMGQKGMPPNMGMMGGPGGPGGNQGPNTMHAQMEWNKLQHQYFEDNKRKGMPGGNMMEMSPNDLHQMQQQQQQQQHPPGMMPRHGMPSGMRNPNARVGGQQGGPQQQQVGPPPPYHQTIPRSASVPIATQSPNPNSPNNPTSNMSLPSPRPGCNSTLNSPAAGDASGRPPQLNPQQAFKHMNPRQSPTTSQDSPAGSGLNRQINHSNPSTPISSHLSPSASLKDLEMSTNPSKFQFLFEIYYHKLTIHFF